MLKKFWEKNWTHWWAGLQTGFGAIFITLQPALNDPSVKDYIHQLNLPIWIGLFLAVMGTITFISMEHKT